MSPQEWQGLAWLLAWTLGVVGAGLLVAGLVICWRDEFGE